MSKGNRHRPKGPHDEERNYQEHRVRRRYINDEISNFTPGDLQFGAMLDIVATVVAKRHDARDDDATFSEIRREILKSLMRDGRWPLTHSCASHYSEFWEINLDD